MLRHVLMDHVAQSRAERWSAVAALECGRLFDGDRFACVGLVGSLADADRDFDANQKTRAVDAAGDSPGSY